MKLPIILLMMTLLASGCANFPAGTTTGDHSASTPGTVQQERKAVRERKVQFGNWRVDCVYEENTLLTQCKAETYSKITEYHGEDTRHPAPILWISWLKGEPKHVRSVCVFGHGYPVTGVSLQIDNNIPLQIGALNAAGCVIADNTLMKQLRAGRELAVTFQRWPWGKTIATFSLNKSMIALNELDRLVAAQ
ncbi:MAG: hypothetical protein WBO57_10530 [Gammaproteobacteria bacterium]